MRIGSLATAMKIASLFLLVQGVAAEAVEVNVLCTTAMTSTASELFAQFERETGHKIVARYDFGVNLRRQVEAGETFDVAILSLDVEDLIKQGKIAGGTRVVLGRTGIGVAVRKGAPKPDISTTDAFKRALLNAKSISYSGGSSGPIILDLFDRLGIASDIKAKLKSSASVSVEDAIATGEPEIIVNGVAVILRVPAAELVGWLPRELQSYVVFTGGVSVAAKEAEAGRSLLNFLTTPTAVATLKAKGVEPVTP